jgi:hypothetical protein
VGEVGPKAGGLIDGLAVSTLLVRQTRLGAATEGGPDGVAPELAPEVGLVLGRAEVVVERGLRDEHLVGELLCRPRRVVGKRDGLLAEVAEAGALRRLLRAARLLVGVGEVVEERLQAGPGEGEADGPVVRGVVLRERPDVLAALAALAEGGAEDEQAGQAGTVLGGGE